MRCPICFNSLTKPFSEAEGRTLMICTSCRHIFWRAMPKSSELSDFYQSQYTDVHNQDEIQHGYASYYSEHALELVRILNQPVEKVLFADIGCSIPIFLEEAKRAGARVLGVDYADEAIEYGRTCGVDVITPEAFSETHEGSVDVLRYSHALEHMIDPVATLTEQGRKVRSGGLLYITQPNFPVARVNAGFVPRDSTYPTHLHFFNPLSIKTMVEAAGFKVVWFFTTTEEGREAKRLQASIDLNYSREMLAELESMGADYRGEMNNFPHFTGQNSALYAVRN